jgi:hypothetical protein
MKDTVRTFNLHFWLSRGNKRARRLMLHHGLLFRGAKMVNPHRCEKLYLPTGADDSIEVSLSIFGYLIAVGISFTPASHGSPCFETWKQLQQ